MFPGQRQQFLAKGEQILTCDAGSQKWGQTQEGSFRTRRGCGCWNGHQQFRRLNSSSVRAACTPHQHCRLRILLKPAMFLGCSGSWCRRPCGTVAPGGRIVQRVAGLNGLLESAGELSAKGLFVTSTLQLSCLSPAFAFISHHGSRRRTKNARAIANTARPRAPPRMSANQSITSACRPTGIWVNSSKTP